MFEQRFFKQLLVILGILAFVGPGSSDYKVLSSPFLTQDLDCTEKFVVDVYGEDAWNNAENPNGTHTVNILLNEWSAWQKSNRCE